MDQLLKEFMTCQANSILTDSLKTTRLSKSWVFKAKIVSKTKACSLMGTKPMEHYKNTSKIFDPLALFEKIPLYLRNVR